MVTLTVTEAGYLRGADGGLDPPTRGAGRHRGAARDPAARVRTAPARLVAGLAARRRADAGPLALVPCDNLPGQRRGGRAGRRATWPSSSTRRWPTGSDELVVVVTTMVDRITPRTTDDDRAAVLSRTGVDDRCPVVTEPFSEWVLSRRLPRRAARAGRTPARRSPTTSRRSSSASCGCSTARTRCWPTPARIRGPRDRRRGGRRRRAAARWLEQWWDGARRRT